MAVTTDRTHAVAPSEIAVLSTPAPADPAPLGLAAFALTTFLISVWNAGWADAGSGAWIGYAFAYGGLCQLLAGMWEFRNRNVFGATAFSTYGGFWIGLALYIELVAPHDAAGVLSNDLGWILLAFAIFNTYMLMWSSFVNAGVFAVFLTLEATEILLFAGQFAGSKGLIEAGGYIGVLTALVAWYVSSAGVINGMTGRVMVPVGGPLAKPALRDPGTV
ncbi:MAG TPA: acetate uptake transporter [Acidimicrobiales bacterium]|nr:acetate uptake transporter [Acidimicrobiales bacterium]